MPQYGYKCNDCEHVFERTLKIKDRNQPVEEACPECNTHGAIIKTLDAPKTVSGVGTNIQSKTPDGFRDVLREIKAGSGRHCTIDI